MIHKRKLLKTEFDFFLKEADGGLEEMEFNGGFASVLFLFPLKKNLQDIFRSFIEECNQYGNFLNEDVIITEREEIDNRRNTKIYK